MGFTNSAFLFLFLPAFTGVYFLTPQRFRNLILLIFSLFFYYVTEGRLLIMLLIPAMINYGAGRMLTGRYRRTCLILALSFNIVLLGFHKYLIPWLPILPGSRMFLSSVTWLTSTFLMPLGISFFTFRAISYLVEIYRGKIPSSPEFIPYLTWFTMFPVIQAGPIVRFTEIGDQLQQRSAGRQKVLAGIEKIIIGLFKKLVIAGTFASIGMDYSKVAPGDISSLIAWIVVISFAFEIYYDFSGYSDIAIGIAKITGFDLPENFNHPYIARDIRDFWRRWHISLSTWLRDYLFLPVAWFLSRKMPGMSYLKVKTEHIIYLFATTITFFICGIWHGSAVNFAVWGLYFAFFLIAEQLFLGRLLKKLWLPLRHVYTLLVVLGGWVIFRAGHLSEAALLFNKMFIPTQGSPAVNSYLAHFIFTREKLVVVVVAILFSAPLYQRVKPVFLNITDNSLPLLVVRNIMILMVFGTALLVSLTYMASNSYSPFIYFKF